MNWLELLSTEISTELYTIMSAFNRRPLPVDATDSHALFKCLKDFYVELTVDIPLALSTEVNVEQAELFTRRFVSVGEWLYDLPVEEGRFLSLALVLRCREILADVGPRALRVRAAIDFFASQGALALHSKAGSAPQLQNILSNLSWTPNLGGISHASYAGPSNKGPLRLNLLKVSSNCELRAVDGRGLMEPRLEKMVADFGGGAGVSGGFFLYSEPNITPPCQRGDPVGLLVDCGQVISPPYFQRSALVRRQSGRCSIEFIGPMDCVLSIEDHTFPLVDLNSSNTRFAAFNSAYGDQAPVWNGPRLQIVATNATVIEEVRAIPTQGLLINLPAESSFKDGQIRWNLPDKGDPIVFAIAGGPCLINPDSQREFNLLWEDFKGQAPPITFSQDETFDQNLLPRMSVGLRDDGTLIFLAVDGREPNSAPGLRLQDCATILKELGCRIGMNLDGGSSKRMVVGRHQVDNSSTEVQTSQHQPKRERPIHSAIVVMPAKNL